jgi:hypothetical protein
VFLYAPYKVNYKAERVPTRAYYDAAFAGDDEDVDAPRKRGRKPRSVVREAVDG